MAFKVDNTGTAISTVMDGVTSPVTGDIQVIELATVSGATATAVNASNPLPVAQTGALPAGNNNIGDMDVATMPAAAYTTDNLGAAPMTGVIMSGTTPLTPAKVAISAATSGNNTLLAAQTSKKIRVVSLFLVAAAAVTITFQSGAGGTALTGTISLAANSGFVLPFDPDGWFETAVTTLLNLSLGGAVQVSGAFKWIGV